MEDSTTGLTLNIRIFKTSPINPAARLPLLAFIHPKDKSRMRTHIGTLMKETSNGFRDSS
jgi:hypothetical protein